MRGPTNQTCPSLLECGTRLSRCLVRIAQQFDGGDDVALVVLHCGVPLADSLTKPQLLDRTDTRNVESGEHSNRSSRFGEAVGIAGHGVRHHLIRDNPLAKLLVGIGTVGRGVRVQSDHGHDSSLEEIEEQVHKSESKHFGWLALWLARTFANRQEKNASHETKVMSRGTPLTCISVSSRRFA